jgi:hypothetical protein
MIVTAKTIKVAWSLLQIQNSSNIQCYDGCRSIFGTSKSFAYFNISNDDQYRKFASKMFAATTVRDRVPYLTFNYNMQTLSQVSLLVQLQF